MINRIVPALTIILLTAGLAACGGGGNEAFRARSEAKCHKNTPPGTDCVCYAKALDRDLDDKTKDGLVKADDLVAAGKSLGDAIKEAGLDGTVMDKLGQVTVAAIKECGKK